jgi:nucleotide-binding universal stress UspA family protein
MKLKKILVTTDFSDSSRKAFPAAAGLARRFGAQLHLVHILDEVPPVLYFSPEGVQTYSPEVDYPARVRELLARTAAEEQSFGGIQVVTHLLQGGSLHDRLLAFEREHRIDLTVVATRGRTSLGHLFLGSFAEKIVRLSPSPVLAWRSREGAAEELEGFAPRRILVPFDFSANSRTILDLVRSLAGTFGARVRLQHVLEPLPDLALIPWEGIPAEEIRERRTNAPERARSELEAVIRAELAGLEGVDAIADFGMPFVDIVKAAREFEADLIVMATHGWTGLKHMLLGSVTEKVVRKAPCSVLTLRPEGLAYEHP